MQLLRQTEVADLDPAFLDEDVFRFEVAMDESQPNDCAKGLKDLEQ